MKIIDIVLIIPLVFGAYKGYQKGLIMELVQLISLILAIVLGLKLYEVGMKYLKPLIGDVYGMLPYVSFAIIFIGVVVLMNFLGERLKSLVKMVLLGWLDNIMGSVLAFLKWGFALSILIWFLHRYGVSPRQSVIEQTIVYSTMLKVAPAVITGIGSVLPFVKSIVRSI